MGSTFPSLPLRMSPSSWALVRSSLRLKKYGLVGTPTSRETIKWSFDVWCCHSQELDLGEVPTLNRNKWTEIFDFSRSTETPTDRSFPSIFQKTWNSSKKPKKMLRTEKRFLRMFRCCFDSRWKFSASKPNAKKMTHFCWSGPDPMNGLQACE